MRMPPVLLLMRMDRCVGLVSGSNGDLAFESGREDLRLLHSNFRSCEMPIMLLLVLLKSTVAGCLDVMVNVGEKLRKLGVADDTMPMVGDIQVLLIRVLCVCSGFRRPAEAITADMQFC
jgi:hypothetical protein